MDRYAAGSYIFGHFHHLPVTGNDVIGIVTSPASSLLGYETTQVRG